MKTEVKHIRYPGETTEEAHSEMCMYTVDFLQTASHGGLIIIDHACDGGDDGDCGGDDEDVCDNGGYDDDDNVDDGNGANGVNDGDNDM